MDISTEVYQRIVSAKIFMDENFDQPLDLDSISRQSCISRFHFHRLFTRIYRKTPHRYLTQKRIDNARQLLAENDLSVSEICSNVGFESIGSFSILFKKEIGFAPQYYRNLAFKKKKLAKEQPQRFIPHCFIETFNLDR
jgi:AraC-like DNA-binding protein